MPSSALLIFGGTFDPPHRAHTVLPPIVARQRHCNRILYVPAALNPLKTDHPPAPAEHRLAMLRLALANVPDTEICRIELDRPGPSYTVETLEALRKQYGSAVALHVLIGSDQALEFQRWRKWHRILELATPAVLLRPPLDASQFHEQLRTRFSSRLAQGWVDWVVDAPQLDIRATELRRRLVADQGLDELIDPRVLEYLRRYGLYRE